MKTFTVGLISLLKQMSKSSSSQASSNEGEYGVEDSLGNEEVRENWTPKSSDVGSEDLRQRSYALDDDEHKALFSRDGYFGEDFEETHILLKILSSPHRVAHRLRKITVPCATGKTITFSRTQRNFDNSCPLHVKCHNSCPFRDSAFAELVVDRRIEINDRVHLKTFCCLWLESTLIVLQEARVDYFFDVYHEGLNIEMKCEKTGGCLIKSDVLS